VRISNLVVRSERQLSAVSKGKPAAAGTDLAAYLASEYADRQDDEPEVEPAAEVEL
jgi:hypothetical protein